MKKKPSPLLRISLWCLLVLALLFTHSAFAVELTPEQLADMPTVSITYYPVQDGDPVVLDATPTLSPLGKAYWAMVPPEAFNFPITLTITASETAPYTFSPTTGDALETDIATVDFDGASTLITAYQNDIMVDTYWLYVSPAEMPLLVDACGDPRVLRGSGRQFQCALLRSGDRLLQRGQRHQCQYFAGGRPTIPSWAMPALP